MMSVSPLLVLFAIVIGLVTGDITLAFNGEKGMLAAPLPVEYVSFNIDSSSLGYDFDFKDVRLRNLVKQVTAPGAWLRIGGTASVGIAFTGPNGRRNGCPGHICINDQLWDEIADFVSYTGVRLLFDFSGNWYNSAGNWDPTLNVTSQLAYTSQKGYGKNWAWQMGNEGTNGHTGTQWGEFFITLKKAIAEYPNIGQTLNGASSSVGGTSAEDFVRTTKGYLDIYSFHHYGPDVKPPFTMKSIKTANPCSGPRQMVDSIAPGVLVALEESACAPLGGHDGICNRFVDGFYYLHTLAAAAETGCHIFHRQDVVGYSFPGLGSGYTLAGPPGWVNSTNGVLQPHPDWYTMVLWKQLVGHMPLGNVTLGGTAAEYDDVDAHVWCGAKKGTVVVIFINGHTSDVHLTSITGLNLAGRTEYILTAPSLDADEIHLNGKQLTVGTDAILPQYPIPGNTVSTTPIVLPTNSYGLIVFNANLPGCA
jgi:hypothetical protein